MVQEEACSRGGALRFGIKVLRCAASFVASPAVMRGMAATSREEGLSSRVTSERMRVLRGGSSKACTWHRVSEGASAGACKRSALAFYLWLGAAARLAAARASSAREAACRERKPGQAPLTYHRGETKGTLPGALTTGVWQT